MKTWYDLHIFNNEDGSWSKISYWTHEEAQEVIIQIIKEGKVNQWYLTEVKVIDGIL